MINYFNIAPFMDKYLLTNDYNEYMFVDKDELGLIIRNRVELNSEFGQILLEKGFLIDGIKDALDDERSNRMRNAKKHLLTGPSLHIFVMTDVCNFNCVYCQAKAGDKRTGNKMSFETAEKAVDIALCSTNDFLTFEFQGGEPLLNFETIRHIVEYTEQKKEYKHIVYNLVTNMSVMNDEIMDFCKLYSVNISSSLDGNELVHNTNRKFWDGRGSYSTVIEKIKLLREKGLYPGAIQTTTKKSLSYGKEIVDSYVENGFSAIFLRPLTPLGNAKEQWKEIGYSPEEFVAFYKETLDYIIKLNMQGIRIVDGFAQIILKMIFNKSSSSYMELRSPCGATLGQMAYYFDGNIYTCDEGRMLSEMGDSAFCLGNVYRDDYNSILDGNVCRATCFSSVLESTPQCCDCAYHPFCGICPVVNYSISKDLLPKGSNNYKCKINKGIFDTIFSILYRNNNREIEILKSWVGN